MLWVGVFQQLSQLQWVFADLLNRREQEAVQGNVDHLLEQPACLEEENVLVGLHELRELDTGVGVVVAVLGVDLEICLLNIKEKRRVRKQENSLGSMLKVGEKEQNHNNSKKNVQTIQTKQIK